MTITFYATIAAGKERPQWMPPTVNYLAPASSWYRLGFRKPRLPAGARVAADCGGFVASRVWGDYRYTSAEYIDWLNKFSPEWAATMDYCCEDEITNGKPGIVRQRQQQTTEKAYEFWRDYRDMPWTWVCTIQGWSVEDYHRHAAEMKPLINDWRRHYGDRPGWRVGIGTLCARADAAMIRRVLATVRDVLPDAPFHLWGVKLALLKSKIALPNVISVDSGAWSPGGLGRSGIEARAEQKSKGMTQREYDYKVALPRYMAKVEAAVTSSKQLHLF